VLQKHTRLNLLIPLVFSVFPENPFFFYPFPFSWFIINAGKSRCCNLPWPFVQLFLIEKLFFLLTVLCLGIFRVKALVLGVFVPAFAARWPGCRMVPM
jgi:hypothetical protein